MGVGIAFAGTRARNCCLTVLFRPGTRITIPAGQEREFLFRPEGVQVSVRPRARIVSVGRPLVGPEGQELKEFVLDVGTSPGIPWMHDEKPFGMRIHAETDFTLEARKSWEWTPEDDYLPSHLFRVPESGSVSRTLTLFHHRGDLRGSNVAEPAGRRRASRFPMD